MLRLPFAVLKSLFGFDGADTVAPDFFAFLFGFDYSFSQGFNLSAQHDKQEHVMLDFLFQGMLITKPQSCFLQLIGQVLIELVHAFELCFEVVVFGGDLY